MHGMLNIYDHASVSCFIDMPVDLSKEEHH